MSRLLLLYHVSAVMVVRVRGSDTCSYVSCASEEDIEDLERREAEGVRLELLQQRMKHIEVSETSVAFESIGRDRHVISRQEPEVDFHLWLNYSIAATAFALTFWCFLRARRGELTPWLETIAIFHGAFGVAALFGGFYHTMMAYPVQWTTYCDTFNSKYGIPTWVIMLNPNNIAVRVWYISMVGILVSEYELCLACFTPILDRKRWIQYYLASFLAFGLTYEILCGAYMGIIICHVLSHTFGIGVCLSCKYYWPVPPLLINLVAALIYGLMDQDILPTGGIHENDWYHGYATVAQVLLQWYLEVYVKPLIKAAQKT